MPPKRKPTNVEKARHYLSGGSVLREDSDDELGLEDHPWDFIYASEDDDSGRTSNGEKRIIGARMGDFECFIGDTVLLKAPAGNEAWVAIIYDLSEGELEDDDGEMVVQKKATMMWFSSEKEIRGGFLAQRIVHYGKF
jgi:origin recognition complex subunit 1